MFETIFENERYTVSKAIVYNGWSHTYPIPSRGIPYIVFSDVPIRATDGEDLVFVRPPLTVNRERKEDLEYFKSKRITARADEDGVYFCVSGGRGYPLKGDFLQLEENEKFYIPPRGGVVVMEGAIEADGVITSEDQFIEGGPLSVLCKCNQASKVCLVWPRPLKEF